MVPAVSGVRCENGLVHVMHMGIEPLKLWALCEVVEAARLDRDGVATAIDRALLEHIPSTHRKVIAYRSWRINDTVDAPLSCLSCIGIMKESIGV